MGSIDKTSIGMRMKTFYEDRYRFYLTRRVPVIVRLDGRAFHTFTRRFNKPYDDMMLETMTHAMKCVCKEIAGAKIAYVASDEISILVTDYDKLTTEAWFDYNISKMVSISAAVCSVSFSQYIEKTAYFDSRVFNVPKEDVTNYFLWRQQDWIRNSVAMLAQSHFSQKQLHKKSVPMMHEMLYTKDVNWAHLENKWKNGIFYIVGEDICRDDMILNRDKDVIDQFLINGE